MDLLLAGRRKITSSSNEITKSLRTLGIPCYPGGDLLICLHTLRKHLDSLCGDEAQLIEAKTRWSRFLEDCLSDWRWARLQVLVRMARECLEGMSSCQDCCDLAEKAKEYLEEAIPLLEMKGFLQPQGQGLYGLLARTALHRATHSSTEPEKRSERIEAALAYARTSVEKEPESASERLVLLEILSELGDPAEMEVQARIARDLDSGPKTLQVIGRSYWKRTFALRDREARQQFLSQAVKFFADTLKQVESAAFDRRDPIEPMKAHGWAHFWLGRFLCERKKTSEAIENLRTAAELGFHPLEARVELAWACLIARDRQQADAAFDEVLLAIRREETRQGPPTIPEERPLNDLGFDAQAGWALLCCDWDPERAIQYVAKAEQRLDKIARPGEGDRMALLREAEGRALLAQGQARKGIAKLEEAVLLGVGGGACCHLGLAMAAQAKDRVDGALERAEELYRLALESDVRGRYKREIKDLGDKVARLRAPADVNSRSA